MVQHARTSPTYAEFLYTRADMNLMVLLLWCVPFSVFEQVDGEPWKQPPSEITVKLHNQVYIATIVIDVDLSDKNTGDCNSVTRPSGVTAFTSSIEVALGRQN